MKKRKKKQKNKNKQKKKQKKKKTQKKKKKQSRRNRSHRTKAEPKLPTSRTEFQSRDFKDKSWVYFSKLDLKIKLRKKKKTQLGKVGQYDETSPRGKNARVDSSSHHPLGGRPRRLTSEV